MFVFQSKKPRKMFFMMEIKEKAIKMKLASGPSMEYISLAYKVVRNM